MLCYEYLLALATSLTLALTTRRILAHGATVDT